MAFGGVGSYHGFTYTKCMRRKEGVEALACMYVLARRE